VDVNIIIIIKIIIGVPCPIGVPCSYLAYNVAVIVFSILLLADNWDVNCENMKLMRVYVIMHLVMSVITMMFTDAKHIVENDTRDSKRDSKNPFLLIIPLIVIGGMILSNATDCEFTNWFLYVQVTWWVIIAVVFLSMVTWCVDVCFGVCYENDSFTLTEAARLSMRV